MATGTFYPVADTDTGFSPPFYPYGYMGYTEVGKWNTESKRMWCRFSEVEIPQGATIVSAVVRFTSSGNNTNTTCSASCAFVAADDPSAPANLAAAASLSLTDTVPWTSISAWTDEQLYDSPNLAAALQAIVDRPGFAGGHVMAVFTDDGSSNDAYRHARAFYSGAGWPQLVVEWADAIPPTDYEVSSAASLAITTFGPEIFAGQNKVYEWEADQTLPFGPFTWKSKLVLLPAMTNFTAARVEADFSADQAAYFAALAERQAVLARNAARISAGGIGGEIAEAPIGTYTLGGDSLEAVPDVGAYSGPLFLQLKVYADGILKQTVDIFSSKPFRLKGGYRSKQYSFQIEGNIAVKKVEIATSIGDLVEA